MRKELTNMSNLDKFRGCLLGGAAGDALGYEVEFMKAPGIFRRFGDRGITEYVLHNGVAQISDDTQMTLFTAAGLLVCTTRGMLRGIMGDYSDYIAYCYQDWLRTQHPMEQARGKHRYSWLMNEPRLYSRRAPGLTCLSVLGSGYLGRIETPINDSKGCGGIMRVAPIGLYFAGSGMPIEQIDRLGAEAAALTHGHELGWLSSAVLVHIIHELVYHPGIRIDRAVCDALDAMEKIFPKTAHMAYQRQLVEKAMDFARADMDDLTAIETLGGGWVGEEALAIAVYCACKYPDDFDKALIASVNHSGDSDSTGAVTGNILGASLGLAGIPAKYRENLELSDVILEIADDLYHNCRLTEDGSCADPLWEQKYVTCTYHK